MGPHSTANLPAPWTCTSQPVRSKFLLFIRCSVCGILVWQPKHTQKLALHSGWHHFAHPRKEFLLLLASFASDLRPRMSDLIGWDCNTLCSQRKVTQMLSESSKGKYYRQDDINVWYWYNCPFFFFFTSYSLFSLNSSISVFFHKSRRYILLHHLKSLSHLVGLEYICIRYD